MYASHDKLKFLSVARTVKEAQLLPFDIILKKISGSVIATLMGIIGYLIMVSSKKGQYRLL